MNGSERKSSGPRTLSDAQLELFIDGALPGDEAARLERLLEASSTDAARLEELRSMDALVRGALLAPGASARKVERRRRAAPLIAAAALLVTAGVAVLIRLNASAPEAPSIVPAPGPGVAARPTTPDTGYEPVRVVLTIPAPSRDRTVRDIPDKASDKLAGAVAAAARPASVIAKEMASAFGDATDAGIRRAVGAINDASPDDRAAALATLGQTLRSGSTAVRILDKLGPRDQVAVCSELALDASLRAVALQRLRDLTENPDVGADARAAVRALAAAPGMKTWLRSYGLLEDPPKPASLEGDGQLPARG